MRAMHMDSVVLPSPGWQEVIRTLVPVFSVPAAMRMLV